MIIRGDAMSDHASKPALLEEVGKQLAAWLATPEATNALREVVERIVKTASELQVERELDAQAVERPVTL